MLQYSSHRRLEVRPRWPPLGGVANLQVSLLATSLIHQCDRRRYHCNETGHFCSLAAVQPPNGWFQDHGHYNQRYLEGGVILKWVITCKPHACYLYPPFASCHSDPIASPPPITNPERVFWWRVPMSPTTCSRSPTRSSDPLETPWQDFNAAVTISTLPTR